MRAEVGHDGVVCTGCMTLEEDVADTAAFVAACARTAAAVDSPEATERAQEWVEVALQNLLRRQSVRLADWPLTAAPPSDH